MRGIEGRVYRVSLSDLKNPKGCPQPSLTDGTLVMCVRDLARSMASVFCPIDFENTGCEFWLQHASMFAAEGVGHRVVEPRWQVTPEEFAALLDGGVVKRPAVNEDAIVMENCTFSPVSTPKRGLRFDNIDQISRFMTTFLEGYKRTQERIEALQRRMGVVEGNTHELNRSTATSLDDIAKKMNALEERLGKVTDRLVDLTAGVNAGGTRLDGHEGDLKLIFERLSSIESRMAVSGLGIGSFSRRGEFNVVERLEALERWRMQCP